MTDEDKVEDQEVGSEEVEAKADDKPERRPTPQDDARAAIYSKRRDVQTSDEEEGRAMSGADELHNLVEKGTKGKSEEAEDAEGVDEGVQADGSKAPDKKAKSPADNDKLASDGEGYTIKVYGSEKQVPKDKVIEAGIRSLQKQEAAEARMEQVATAEAQLKAYEEELQAYQRNLAQGLDKDGQPVAKKAAGKSQDTPPPSSGADDTELKQSAETLLRTMFSGDIQKSTDVLTKILSDVSGRGKPSATQVSDDVVSSVAGRVREQLQKDRKERERVEANTVFRTEFADVAQDTVKMAGAAAMVNKLMRDPSNKDRPMPEIAREVGEYMRKHYGTPDKGTEAQDEIVRRTAKKRQAPSTSSSASGRVPPPKPDAPLPSNSEYVQQLARMNRGEIPRR